MNSFSTDKKSKGVWEWDIVKLVLAISVVSFAGIFYLYGFTEAANRIAIRLTARISFVLFGLAFAASGIHLFFRQSATFWLLMNRKYLGISFALIHLIHLLFILLLQVQFHPVFEMAATISLLAGGLAYLFLVAMLLTSFEQFAKYLSKKQWKLLHTVGGYWILFIFTTSYTKRFMTEWEWLPFLIGIGLVLFFRSYATWVKRTAN